MMKTYILILLWFLGAILVGCSRADGGLLETGIPTDEPEVTVTIEEQIPSPRLTASEQVDQATESLAGEDSVEVILPDKDQVIFTIPNDMSWSGREGDPRPDWKGWGAGTFIAGEDGSFWIADTAVVPIRLLNYNASGELLQDVPVPEEIVYVNDFVFIENSFWILDAASMPAQIAQLDLNGNFLTSFEVAQETFDLLTGTNNELLALGLDGYTMLVDAKGDILQEPIDSLTFYGNEFTFGPYEPVPGRLPVFLNGEPIESAQQLFPDVPPFLGFSLDGSFALAGYQKNGETLIDKQVWFFGSSGNLIGKARQYPQTIYHDWNHHLAFRPDGAVFQLLSNPDHSVQIVRLGFVSDLPQETIVPTPAPTTLSTLATIDPAESDEEQAQNTLIQFFQFLSEGKPAKARPLFGGSIQEMSNFYGDSSGMTDADYWEDLCQFLWCLPVAEITGIEKVSDDEYIFQTVFVDPNGTRFGIGACCGADPAAFPTVHEFAYPVRRIGEAWLVMRLPLYTP